MSRVIQWCQELWELSDKNAGNQMGFVTVSIPNHESISCQGIGITRVAAPDQGEIEIDGSQVRPRNDATVSSQVKDACELYKT